jgi:hypothetical protein
MCKRSRGEGVIHAGQPRKVGSNAITQSITGDIAHENESTDEEDRVRLVEAPLLLAFTSKSDTDVIIAYYI